MNQPIRWLGDQTQDRDVWELSRRRERFTMLGGPTTLYFTMDDGTRIIVPAGWWIYDWHTEHPFVSSAAPPASAPATDPGPALRGELAQACRARDEAVIALGRLLSAWLDNSNEGSAWEFNMKAAEREAGRILAKYPNLCPGAAPSFPSSTEVRDSRSKR